MDTPQEPCVTNDDKTSMQDSPTFQIMSDLHLEFGKGYKKFQIPPCAPYLCLLGDIGRTVDERLFPFLERQLNAFKVVFFLLGNHEAYGSSYAASKERLAAFSEHCQQQRASDPDLGEFVLLDQTRYDVSDQVTVLGCTLYSNVLPEQEEDVSLRVNDFYGIEKWSVADHNAAHRSDVEWLQRELAALSEKEPSRRVIVLTHHSPTMVSDPRYRDSPLTSVFSTDLVPRQFDGSQICVWGFGHTHYNSDFTAGGVRLFSNQRGYVHDLSVGFDVKKVVGL
jgi:hypothetical protein